MTLALTTATTAFLACALVMLALGLLLSRARGGGWRFRSRDVAQPTPDADGDAIRTGRPGDPDPLTPRGERETPQRELRY